MCVFCRANLRQIAIGMKFSARCFRLCAQKTERDSEVSDYSRTRVDREVPAGMTSFRFLFSGKTILHAQNIIMRTAVNVGLFYLTLYINKRENKKLYKLYINPTFNPAFR